MSAMLRLLAWVLAVALVALPVVALVNGWVGGERWPLRTLRLQGELRQVDRARLQAAILPHAQRGFFAVELDRIQSAVSALPWVEHAEVRKQWPDILEVRIDEHRPIAHWGKDKLLSEAGRVFPAADLTVEEDPENLDGLNFLSGMAMRQINRRAMQGTILAHTRGGVPNLVLEVPAINEEEYGYMVYFFMLACGVSGYLLGVNPFDQPGVEAYKKNMFALLGKPGYEDLRQELLEKLGE